MSAVRPTAGHWPREHGAWAQLLMPLAAALLCGRATTDSLLLALAALSLFVAHEPLLVLRGQRGKRALGTDAPAAHRHFLQRLGLALPCGLWVIAHQPRSLLPSLGVVALLGAAPVVLALLGRSKALAVPWLASTALAALAWPVALTAGMGHEAALLLATTWATGFSLMTTSVHACKARALSQPSLTAWVTVSVGTAGGALLGALLCEPWQPLAPMALAAIVLTLLPVRLRFMSRVGWLLAAASLATLLLQVRATRAGN